MIALLALLAAAPIASSMTTVKGIDDACRVAMAHGTSHEQEQRLFADVSDGVLPKPGDGTWRALKDESELKALGKNGNAPNTQARFWRSPTGVAIVSMFFQSDSGDWAHLVDYWFRPDGSLAKMDGTFNSFVAAGNGRPISRHRVQYFGRDSVLRSRTVIRDFETKRPLRKVDTADEDDPLYRSLRELPFVALLPAPDALVAPSGSDVSTREVPAKTPRPADLRPSR